MVIIVNIRIQNMLCNFQKYPEYNSVSWETKLKLLNYENIGLNIGFEKKKPLPTISMRK